jgi:hypothetical protein
MGKRPTLIRDALHEYLALDMWQPIVATQAKPVHAERVIMEAPS